MRKREECEKWRDVERRRGERSDRTEDQWKLSSFAHFFTPMFHAACFSLCSNALSLHYMLSFPFLLTHCLSMALAQTYTNQFKQAWLSHNTHCHSSFVTFRPFPSPVSVSPHHHHPFISVLALFLLLRSHHVLIWRKQTSSLSFDPVIMISALCSV